MNNSNELMDALRKADAAGNEDDARAIAAMIQREEPSQTPEPSSEEDSLEAYLQAQADAENANRTALGRGFSRSVDSTTTCRKISYKTTRCRGSWYRFKLFWRNFSRVFGSYGCWYWCWYSRC